jgi:hypothetical protein
MTNSLYRVRSVSSTSVLLIAYVKPSKMLKPRILKTSFRMSSGPKAFPLSRWFKTL